MVPTSSAIEGRSTRKLLGQFYTPPAVAAELVRWGLAGTAGTVLDPSFGGCSFLDATLSVLGELGVEHPGRNLYGVDIDPRVQPFRQQLVDRGVPAHQLLIDDFFRTAPHETVIPQVDLVVGNPPYVRHHWFQAEARARASRAVALHSLRLHGRSNAWAYFLVHATSFLKHGGKIALLLPRSSLFTEFAITIREFIRNSFRRARIIQIDEKVVPDAREEIVVLLAEGHGVASRDIELIHIPRTRDLPPLLQHATSPAAVPHTPELPSAIGLPPTLLQIYHDAIANPRISRLGDLATIKIGVVTGANRFFVRTATQARALAACGALSVPILARSRNLRMVTWTHSDHLALEAAGKPAHLVLVHDDLPLRGELRSWVAEGEAAGIPARFKCRNRKAWYAIYDTALPDAFLRYMGTCPPLVTLNPARATCTNAIHRLWWKHPTYAELIAIASCTSLFALACEMWGRAYGGGVLKVEPGAVARLPIPVVGQSGLELGTIDEMLRCGHALEARDEADRFLLERGLGLSHSDIKSLRLAAHCLASRRNGPTPSVSQ